MVDVSVIDADLKVSVYTDSFVNGIVLTRIYRNDRIRLVEMVDYLHADNVGLCSEIALRDGWNMLFCENGDLFTYTEGIGRRQLIG